ncbi:OprD family outer membrane porin [Acinetobacter pseudolwoffii]|uniref:Outer membrane porin, OprD family n=1 Tax=Acinetobacter pseudolwoffii TaxID=2053287 RepID=A0A2H9UMF6_9GAMM|nr:OprD family outer membrane porin [Acinetobacter pseudolwoffii]PJI32861.1 outer membrane porin, OprD family [Acinetobacter pseudolwoffii]PJO76962.1 outer membrane porin, OprD family [Acinetobacter pseudolwoffii]
MRRQNLWIAMFAAIATLGTTAANADFIDDSNVQLKFKNFYLDRQYQDDASSRNWGSWSQGVTLDAKSGYHDIGAGIKVGADVLVQHAVKLKGRDKNPDWVLPHDGKQSKDHFGKVGATLKAKVSETELKVGELLPVSPVLVFDPSRQLLTTYSGAWLESKELKDTKLTLAYIDRINNRYDNQFRDLTKFNPPQFDNGAEADGMWIAGIDHQLTKELGASYWYADVQDIYQQHYLGVNYKIGLGEKTKLDSHVRYFNNSESGDKLYGEIDNQALSVAAKINHGAHTVGVGYQQMFGDSAFPTLGGWVPQPYLANWGVSTFTAPEEKSWHVSYGYDFSEVGLKGLNATAIYFKGYDQQGTGVYQSQNFNTDEVNAIVNYTVPEGKLKGLGVQGMYIDVNFANPAKPDLQEYRVATTYTYKF